MYGVEKVVVGGVVVYVRVGECGVRLKVEWNGGESDEVSELLGGVCGKAKLVVWSEEHGGIAKVHGGAIVWWYWMVPVTHFFTEVFWVVVRRKEVM